MQTETATLAPTDTKSPWKFRLARPEDAPLLSKWCAENNQIDPKDIEAADRKNNPTVVFFVVENSDGVIVACAPVFTVLQIAHLIFNPESSAESRKQAMQAGTNGIMGFAASCGVRRIGMLSRESYGPAQVAMKLGFDLEPRQYFCLDMHKQAALAENEQNEQDATLSTAAQNHQEN